MGWIEDAGNFIHQNVVQPIQQTVVQPVQTAVSQVISSPTTSTGQPYISGGSGYNPTPISSPVQNQISTMTSPINVISQIRHVPIKARGIRDHANRIVVNN